MDVITQFLMVLFICAVLGWFSERFLYSSFIGYVIGGFIASVVFTYMGTEASFLTQVEFLKTLGLTIFALEVGLSIGIDRVLKSLNRVLTTEIISYPILWVLAMVIVYLCGLDSVFATVLFLMFIDSSSFLAVTLANRFQPDQRELRDQIVLETSFEDLVQFTMFSIVFIAGVSKLSIENIAVNAAKIAALLVLLAYMLSIAMKRLKNFVFSMDSTTRYLFLLSIALLYSVLAELIGLPPLLGAFIAGVILSEYIDVREFTFFLGIRELGLLLYFSSLGAQLVFGVADVEYLLIGVAVGIVAVFARILSLMLGSVISGLHPSYITSFATVLSSISESSVVFIDILISKNIVPDVFRFIVIASTTTSFLVTPIVFKRRYILSRIVESSLPGIVNDVLMHISYLLTHSSSVIINVGRDIVKFLAVLFAAIYILHIVSLISKYFDLVGSLLLTVSMGVSYVVIVISFSKTMRKIITEVFTELYFTSIDIQRVFTKFITTVITLLSIILLLLTLYTILVEAKLPTLFHSILAVSINTVFIATLIYIALSEIRKTPMRKKL